MDAIARKGREARTQAGTDGRLCSGTSNNSNMPAISRGDALMRDATGRGGGRGRGGRSRGQEGTAHRGRAVSSRAKDESLMRSQPRDYPVRSRQAGRQVIRVCYRWASECPRVATCRRNVIIREGGRRGYYEFAAGADLRLIALAAFRLLRY